MKRPIVLVALAIPLLGGASAPPASPRTAVAAMFAAFNAHDPAAMARLYAPDARLTSSDFCAPRRGTDVQRTYAALFAAMPDLNDQVDTVVAEGDRVAVRFTATSSNTGLRLPIVSMLRVQDGLIVEDDSVFDAGGRICTS